MKGSVNIIFDAIMYFPFPVPQKGVKTLLDKVYNRESCKEEIIEEIQVVPIKTVTTKGILCNR